MSRMSLKPNFAEIVDEYQKLKNSENTIKKQALALNTQLKDEMLSKNLTSIDGTGEYCVTLSTTQKESLNEERAIEILKESLPATEFNSVVKMKPYIDDDALEKLVYNGKFDMSKLECCRILSAPTHTLRISKKG